MRISDWSSDVCSSDLTNDTARALGRVLQHVFRHLTQHGTDFAMLGIGLEIMDDVWAGESLAGLLHGDAEVAATDVFVDSVNPAPQPAAGSVLPHLVKPMLRGIGDRKSVV